MNCLIGYNNFDVWERVVNLKNEIQRIGEEALRELKELDRLEALQELKVKVLGKKGSLTALLRQMGSLSPEERPIMGQIVNEVRSRLEQAWEERSAELDLMSLTETLGNGTH